MTIPTVPDPSALTYHMTDHPVPDPSPAMVHVTHCSALPYMTDHSALPHMTLPVSSRAACPTDCGDLRQLMPLFAALGFGVGLSAFYTLRLATRNPDVTWRRTSNPEPWEEFRTAQYKVTAGAVTWGGGGGQGALRGAWPGLCDCVGGP